VPALIKVTKVFPDTSSGPTGLFGRSNGRSSAVSLAVMVTA